jgi:hypothetical protein
MKTATRAFWLGMALVVLASWISGAKAADEKQPNRLFEMRTYTTNEGKLADLHKRFREHTNRLFLKHGMTLIAYWTPVDGPLAENTLVYVLAYPDRESREKSWKAFMADPEWQAAYKASHENGPLVKNVVSQFLTPTDYSPIK